MTKENIVRISEYEEAEFRKKSKYLDAVVEYVPLGLAVIETESRRVTLVSRCAALHLGRSREELEGTSVDELIKRWDIFKSDGTSRPTTEDFPIFRTIQSKKCIEDEEWVFRKPNGARVTVLMSACPVITASGDVAASVLSWVDISEHKATEEKLRNLNYELNEALRKVKVLSGMVKVCAVCKRIQDDRGNWVTFEKYIEDRSEAVFSHVICPDCAKRVYGETEEIKEEES